MDLLIQFYKQFLGRIWILYFRVLIKFWSRQLGFKSRRLGNRVPVSPSSISWKSRHLNTWSVAGFLAGCWPLMRTLIFCYSRCYVNDCFLILYLFSSWVHCSAKTFLNCKSQGTVLESFHYSTFLFFWNSCIKFVKMLVSLFFWLRFCRLHKFIFLPQYIVSPGFQNWSFKCLKSYQTNQSYLWWLK